MEKNIEEQQNQNGSTCKIKYMEMIDKDVADTNSGYPG